MAEENYTQSNDVEYMTSFSYRQPDPNNPNQPLPAKKYIIKDAEGRKRIHDLETDVIYKDSHYVDLKDEDPEKDGYIDNSTLVGYDYNYQNNEVKVAAGGVEDSQHRDLHTQLDILSKAALYEDPKLPTVEFSVSGNKVLDGANYYVGQLIQSVALTYKAKVIDNNPGRVREDGAGNWIPYGILDVRSLTALFDGNESAIDDLKQGNEVTIRKVYANKLITEDDVARGSITFGNTQSIEAEIAREVNPHTAAMVPENPIVVSEEIKPVVFKDFYYPCYHGSIDTPIEDMADYLSHLPGSGLKDIENSVFSADEKDYCKLNSIGSRSGKHNVNEYSFHATKATPKYFLYVTHGNLTDIVDETSGMATFGAWKQIGTYTQKYTSTEFDGDTPVTFTTNIVFNVWITTESYINDQKFSFNA